MKKFIQIPFGEKIRLVNGKISYKDKGKVIPEISESIRLRNELKKLKPYKIDYRKLKK